MTHSGSANEQLDLSLPYLYKQYGNFFSGAGEKMCVSELHTSVGFVDNYE